MKITGARIRQFLGQANPGLLCVLVYGPDRGLARERADILARHVVDDPADPFRVAHLTAAQIRDDPARLADEAAALSLTGGRRVVRITEAADGLTAVFKDFLKTAASRSDGPGGPGGPGNDGALVVVEAGELGPRSSLRRLFEGAEGAAALACYADDARGLNAVIAETLARHGLTATREALGFLAENLGGDRLMTRGELEKLALYMGGPGTVELADAMASVGDSARVSLDAVVYAACGGDRRALDAALARAFSDGVQPVSLLRAAARHLQRLHLAAAFAERGKSPAQAMAALRPPVIFLFKDRFQAQMRRWPQARLAAAMELICEAELSCKTTGLPAEALCGRALMRLAQAAQGAAKGAMRGV